ncbi:unnamed protein product [Vitrella brassicaformis CCMP3155]|uniref:Uncharacterized protein n=2 Tax=Vitrella brassicaformis TaxID=1169539 RepID=A0A0G4EJW8_VITBC|nr:unnamed protein product [Vitrella brassicaformis CCMP3155]|eukprot:CEL97047.1 unnamed protein product [Vitrella brassicaformis CCMP3155]
MSPSRDVTIASCHPPSPNHCHTPATQSSSPETRFAEARRLEGKIEEHPASPTVPATKSPPDPESNPQTHTTHDDHHSANGALSTSTSATHEEEAGPPLSTRQGGGGMTAWRVMLPFLENYVDVFSMLALRQLAFLFLAHKWNPVALDFSGLRGIDSRVVVESILALLQRCLHPAAQRECAYDFGQCTLLKDSSLVRIVEKVGPSIRSLSFDFCYLITDKGLEALLSTPLPRLERLSLRCARNKELIGEPILRELSAERWPRFHQFNCAFTSMWLEHIENVAEFLADRAERLKKAPKLDINGSWASKCLLEKIGLHDPVKRFGQAVHLRVADVCEKIAKKMKHMVVETAEKAPHAQYRLLQIVKYQGDQLLVNSPCTHHVKAAKAAVEHPKPTHTYASGSLKEPSAAPAEDVYLWTHPLSVAIEGMDINTLAVLLRHGAKVDVWDYLGNSPLFLACKTDQEDVVHTLIEHGACVHPYDLLGPTPLKIAVHNQNIDILHMLLDHGANLNFVAPALKPRGFKSPLFVACESNAPEIIQLLLDKGANPNWVDHSKYSPTLLAYQLSSSWLPKFLDAGAGASPRKRYILTDVLTCGILKADMGCVKLLTSKYPDLLDLPHHMWSLPHIQAAKLGKVDILRYLLQQGSRTNSKGLDGAAALHVATEEGFMDCVMALLNAHEELTTTPDGKAVAKADVNIQDASGRTPLLIACLENRHSVAEVLLRRGADVNRESYATGETPLMACIRTRNELMALLLLKFGVDLNFDQQDKRGRTALIYAIYFGQYLIADKLLARGADVTAQDETGTTPYNVMLNRVRSNGQQAKLCKKVVKAYRTATSAAHHHHHPNKPPSPPQSQQYPPPPASPGASAAAAAAAAGADGENDDDGVGVAGGGGLRPPRNGLHRRSMPACFCGVVGGR